MKQWTKKKKENDPAHDENIQPADIESTREFCIRSRKQPVDFEQPDELNDEKEIYICLNSQKEKKTSTDQKQLY